jgi:cytochrome P450
LDLLVDPVWAFERIGARADGRVVRPHLGLVRPYLVTSPEHVQYVLRDRAPVYRRDGMMWTSIRRLLGNGIITDGATWEPRRANIQPLFSGRHIDSLVNDLAAAVNDSVDELTATNRPDRPVDMTVVMSAVAESAFSRTLFGGRLTATDSRRFTEAVQTAFRSVASRILLPFVPHSVPMPGDRAFRRAIRDVDAVMFPLVRDARADTAERTDVLSALVSARDGDGAALSDQEIRDDAVSLFAAGYETSAVALAWLWVVLGREPEIANRLHREVASVVGGERPGAVHLPGLSYTKMVVQEVLRRYSPGWIIPRVAAEDDVIDGMRIKAGGTVLISPYLTHRLPRVWPEPQRFDPERFTAERIAQRHRFAYLPFGGGPHGCIGSHFFLIEAQLAVAAVLSRFRPERVGTRSTGTAVGASLRPRRPVLMTLRPRAA